MCCYRDVVGSGLTLLGVLTAIRCTKALLRAECAMRRVWYASLRYSEVQRRRLTSQRSLSFTKLEEIFLGYFDPTITILKKPNWIIFEVTHLIRRPKSKHWFELILAGLWIRTVHKFKLRSGNCVFVWTDVSVRSSCKLLPYLIMKINIYWIKVSENKILHFENKITGDEAVRNGEQSTVTVLMFRSGKHFVSN